MYERCGDMAVQFSRYTKSVGYIWLFVTEVLGNLNYEKRGHTYAIRRHQLLILVIVI